MTISALFPDPGNMFSFKYKFLPLSDKTGNPLSSINHKKHNLKNYSKNS